MAKFEVTHGKAVKSYDKDTKKPICYEIGDVVEAEKMPSYLVGKCRELAEKPKLVEKPKAKTAAEKKAEKEAEDLAAAEAEDAAKQAALDSQE